MRKNSSRSFVCNCLYGMCRERKVERIRVDQFSFGLRGLRYGNRNSPEYIKHVANCCDSLSWISILRYSVHSHYYVYRHGHSYSLTLDHLSHICHPPSIEWNITAPSRVAVDAKNIFFPEMRNSSFRRVAETRLEYSWAKRRVPPRSVYKRKRIPDVLDNPDSRMGGPLNDGLQLLLLLKMVKK